MSIIIHIVDGPLPRPTDWHFEGAGAVICFDGVVRPEEAGSPIAGLEYEVYSPMAERQLQQLAEDILQRHPGVMAIDIVHSRGYVPNHRVSFRMRVASRHRAEGLAAMGEFIDRMKKDVPIWKKAVHAH